MNEPKARLSGGDTHLAECYNTSLEAPVLKEGRMSEFVYVDNSNVFIEGKRVSAVDKGMAMDIWEAFDNKILDQPYSVDFGKLHDFVAGSDPRQIKRALLFGSRPPPNDSLWHVAKQCGFEVIVEDRNVRNREKKIDTGLVAAMTRDAYTKTDREHDVITLVGGDGDYVPAVRQLVDDGFQVEVVFWDHASNELKDVCSKFVNLNPHLRMLEFSR